MLLRLAPGDPAELRLLGSGGTPSPDALAALRALHRLDRPLGAQFLAWLGEIARGGLGRSLATDRPVLANVAARLPWSAAIGVGGLALALALGPPLGYAAALRPGGGADRLSRALAVLAQAVPAFAAALALYWLIAVEWRLVRPATGGVAERLAGPVLFVALFSTGAFARVAAGAFGRAERAPWFTRARAKGLSRAAALRRHGGLAGLALVAALVPGLGWAIGGTAVVELVFGVPGLSAFLVEAAGARDYAVVQAYVLFVAAWLAGAAWLAHAAERWIDLRRTWGDDGAADPDARRRPRAPRLPGSLPHPGGIDLGRALSPPSVSLPLGADHLGWDVAARLAAGAWRSMRVLALFAGTAVPLGLALGLAAASNGPAARAVGFALRLGAAVPAFVLALAVAAAVGLSPVAAGLALGLAAAAQYGLLTEAHARACLRETYVHAAGPWARGAPT